MLNSEPRAATVRALHAASFARAGHPTQLTLFSRCDAARSIANFFGGEHASVGIFETPFEAKKVKATSDCPLLVIMRDACDFCLAKTLNIFCKHVSNVFVEMGRFWLYRHRLLQVNANSSQYFSKSTKSYLV